MNYSEIEKMALEAGFSYVMPLVPKTIELKQDVRDMCLNGCAQYGKRWSCPPGCGTLEECREKISHYPYGILLQTVGELEDEFDGEGMMDVQDAHKEHFEALLEMLHPNRPDILPIGTGCCTLCKTCTYPNAPCRFPDKKISSMEAFGMLVLEVCKANGMTYYHGPNTIAYTACILF